MEEFLFTATGAIDTLHPRLLTFSEQFMNNIVWLRDSAAKGAKKTSRMAVKGIAILMVFSESRTARSTIRYIKTS